ncbi:MAG: NADH-quinone oxidoreductase subunit NuoF [Armatimonadota bacterium]|nr:MAG: NADH-quinone oxidoreductase subunit NuoF [Armatimonadota bacterium]
MYRSHVLLCAGAGCVSSGEESIRQALAGELNRLGLDGEVKLVETGCMGICDLGPIAVVYPDGVFYQRLTPDDARDVAEQHLLKGRVVNRLLYTAPETGEQVTAIGEIPFFLEQRKVVLENCGLIDPAAIDEYIARDGYAALGKVLTEMTPQQVIDELKASGLRGRGGAGFPTGVKWQFVHDAPGKVKYVVCNADEGDPGAFMDRSVLEGDPHRVIEAMTIAAYAVGAHQGYVYVRAEYPLAVARLGVALDAAREMGLLGKNILGSGFDFRLEIRIGAGAFVCGEETALLASIEGRRGEPRPRPPFPAQRGLWGKPTVLNNVETYANVPTIIRRGGAWFAEYGTEKSKGTKVFALAGDINNTGLVEIPMGTPLGRILYDIGGGIRDGKKFKAAQTGGPSGGCIPVQYLNVPMDYESLKELGAIMGSGGLIVMDEDTCMVDMARFFLDFVQDESCGKCPPCRIGTRRMLEIVTRITEGKGEEGDVERLVELCENVKTSALCGLGQTAVNPVLSTIRHFREEYDAHIREKRCPAAVCRGLFRSPCQHTCPVGVDVPGYVELIAAGRFAEATDLVRERNPFPSICGRVCTHPCESKCLRGQLDEPIAIASLKRFTADAAARSGHKWQPELAPSNGRRVAIIGGGPAGLNAAYHLRKRGYAPTVFESSDRLGGMLVWGIPEYRLPRDVIEREIQDLVDLGVEVRTNQAWGREFTLDSLRADGHEAILLAIGAHKGLALGVDGEALDGVADGVRFLRQANAGQVARLDGKRVAVIGGGDVAIDAARTAVRLGADKVTLVYRRTKAEMPAHEKEIEWAEQEGVELRFLLAPERVVGNGKVTGLKCAQMALGDFDSSGRRRPQPIPGSAVEIEADVVISAIGQAPDVPSDGNGGPKRSRRGTVEAEANTLATTTHGVFAAGDAVSGPWTVIQALAQGERAASAIDRYLRGEPLDAEVILVGHAPPDPAAAEGEGEADEGDVEERPRAAMPCVAADQRRTSFCEVESGFDETTAIAEASRCLHCHRS